MAKLSLGDIRHHLRIIEIIPNSNSDLVQFNCECILCGGNTIIRRNKFGITKSCGCLLTVKGESHPQFNGYKEINGGKWKSYIRNAHNRKINFDISIEYAYSVYENQNKTCAISGVPIQFWDNATTRRATASLDRIDNTKGYVVGNIQWVHKKVNQIKMDMSVDDLIKWCKKIVIHNSENNT